MGLTGRDLLGLATQTARAAGALLLDHAQHAPVNVSSKSSRTDQVSDADRAAEALIVAAIRAARPGDRIVAEEGGGGDGGTGLTWYVDPLDGTTNFLYGIPHWAVSIGCEDADGAVAGAVYDPLRDELFAAQRGGGAFLGVRPLAVRPLADPATALVATGFSYDPAERGAQTAVAARLAPRIRDLRRSGAASLDLAWVAAGRLDAYTEVMRSRWDWSAGALLVTEAGGRVSWTAREEIVASGPLLHDRLLLLLREAHEQGEKTV